MSDFYVFDKEQPVGPFTKADLIGMVAGGQAQRSDPCMSASRPEVQTVGDAVDAGERVALEPPDPARGGGAAWQSDGARMAQWARGQCASGYELKSSPRSKPTITRSRGVYIILGIAFGGLGFNNFYSGHHAIGALKLVCTCVGVGVGQAAPPALLICIAVAVWTLVELFIVTEDADGNLMA
jgi:TM2 domain-containing membrane protein YozV